MNIKEIIYKTNINPIEGNFIIQEYIKICKGVGVTIHPYAYQDTFKYNKALQYAKAYFINEDSN